MLLGRNLLFFSDGATYVMFRVFNTIASSKLVKKLSVVTFLPELLKTDQIQNSSLTNIHLPGTIYWFSRVELTL